MTATIIDKTTSMVKEYMSAFDPSHDFLHVDRVRNLALFLAKECIKQGDVVDLEIVELAGLCHDVGDAKYYKGKQTGGDIVQSFLIDQGYRPDRAALVARIVNHIGFRKELAWDDTKDDAALVDWRNHCRELHVVQDADKLDAIGAFGVMRCAAYSGATRVALFDATIDPMRNMTKDQYEAQSTAKNGSAINHFHEKLFRLKDMLRTEAGRRMGKERHEFMVQFVEQIRREYNMQT
ncbi:hypothetical protein DM01DRAFT_1338879 [Hesseltinella vesiculosa]|uniref:HD/PDEase domain-containing protein n=1 Tax=Hesseltinella vesiculosa TaxID=101127 RepID=A0A1X2GA30_9FUNG|nr:hypothetical protein DM01DRAFT_1338879 [Hesseltinella vesiculosa]